jgi:ankyrin repeat protein
LERARHANQYGGTPLLAAAHDGNYELVRLLAEEGKASTDQVNHDDETPLLNAMHQGHYDVVRLLVRENNASVEQANKEKQTPLFAAIERCSADATVECDMDM